MPRKRWTIVAVVAVLCMVVVVSPGDATQKIRIRAPQSEVDRSHAYFVSLLQLALDKTADTNGRATVAITTFNASQARVLQELAVGQHIDVEWTGTNHKREKDLYPVRFPLVGGLTGWRIPIVRKDRLGSFENVRDLNDFRQFTAVQGLHWPDADILEAAGIAVVRVATFEQIYPILKIGRADCSPRGIQAVTSELQGGIGEDFAAVTGLIIRYPFPMYFFTSRQNSALGARIEAGLRMALNDKSFMQHMRSHPVTRPIFPLSRFAKATIIDLPNPYLPPETPLTQSDLWLRVK